MVKQQDWSVTTCVLLFLFLASQIHCRSGIHVSKRLEGSKQGDGKSGDTSFNVLRRVLSPKEKDLIKKLPGQPSGVSFRQYGGYVPVNEPSSRFLYYYFVEAIKPNTSTPLVIWFNGGTHREYRFSTNFFFFIGLFYNVKRYKSSTIYKQTFL